MPYVPYEVAPGVFVTPGRISDDQYENLIREINPSHGLYYGDTKWTDYLETQYSDWIADVNATYNLELSDSYVPFSLVKNKRRVFDAIVKHYQEHKEIKSELVEVMTELDQRRKEVNHYVFRRETDISIAPYLAWLGNQPPTYQITQATPSPAIPPTDSEAYVILYGEGINTPPRQGQMRDVLQTTTVQLKAAYVELP